MYSVRKMRIQHFQSHKDTMITFAPQGELTVIVGPSNSGKTAALRALKWVCYNEPDGIGYIQVGETTATVTLTMASGAEVIRERSKTVNRYTVISADGERQVFEGFGRNVPLEVQRVTGVSPVTVGDTEITLNFAEQLDGPFLGSGISGSARARVLGKLAGTEEIDLAGKTLGTELYRKEQQRKAVAAEIKELETQMKRFDGLLQRREALHIAAGALVEAERAYANAKLIRGIGAKLAGYTDAVAEAKHRLDALMVVIPKAEVVLIEATALQERATRLTTVQGAHQRAEQAKQGAAAVLSRTEKLQTAQDALNDARSDSERLGGVNTLKAKLDATAVAKLNAQAKLEQTARIDEAAEALSAGATMSQHIAKIEAARNAYAAAERTQASARERVGDARKAVETTEAEYAEFLRATGSCPLCGGDLSGDKSKEATCHE